MKKGQPHNPHGFEKDTWNYRCLQLRHALGWSQKKLAQVMGAEIHSIRNLETGELLRPPIPTIEGIRNMESAYADILEAYKKSPIRLSRLYRKRFRGETASGVYLLPIEIRQPEDIGSVEDLGTDSGGLFFGRKTRRTMPQTGMSVRRKTFLRKRGEAIARGHRKKAVGGGSQPKDDKPE